MDAVIPLAGQAPVVTGEAGLADLPLRTNAWVQGLHMEAAAEDGDLMAAFIDGAITLAWEGQTQTFRPGEIFTMARGCHHTETFGPEGAVTLVGRKH